MIHFFIFLFFMGLSAYFWFVIPKDAQEESTRGSIKIIKAFLGMKGYIILAKVLAVFIALSGLSELYKFVISIIN